FGGFPASHGTHEYFRHGGSIGNRSYAGRVCKGKRMAGRYGADRVTTRNLEVVAVRPDDHLILVRGAVPGARNGTVIVQKPPGAAVPADDTADDKGAAGQGGAGTPSRLPGRPPSRLQRPGGARRGRHGGAPGRARPPGLGRAARAPPRPRGGAPS